MKKKLLIVQNISIAVAVLSIFTVMFLVGDTDVGAEAPAPWITFAISSLATLACLTYAFIQFIGLPSLIENQPEEKKPKKDED
jgi:NADH:ubiquinone oxidoreductase subunit 6 (subunit J)